MSEESSAPQPQALTLRILKGVHSGALTPLAPSGMLLIGAGDDCDVILCDSGVATHHCILSKLDTKLFLRAVDAALMLGETRLEPGRSLCVAAGTPVEVGSAAFELAVGPLAGATGVRPGETLSRAAALQRHAKRLFRQFRWGIIATLSIAAAVAGALHPSPLDEHPPAAPVPESAATTTPATPATVPRPDAAIAGDVEEVLRLSGIASEARYEGDGAVSVRGHLGNPQMLSEIIQSRAMHEIVGLKRVLAFNLDESGQADAKPTANPASAADMRIISAISSADSYVVTADGSRYYVGAELPQGGRLTGVQEGEVLVERNGQIEHLKLPGTRSGASNHQEKRS
ncbi:MAG TPA: FHA domain-containing protein [Steroidobacteraceae bacterium]